MEDSKECILYIEDDERDIADFRQKVSNLRYKFSIITKTSGSQGLDYLYRSNYENHSDLERPDVIFIDIKLPDTDGIEILHEIKHDRRLRDTPVYMVSAGNEQKKINECYQEGAELCLDKPVDFTDPTRFLHSIHMAD